MKNKSLNQEVVDILSKQQLETLKEWMQYGTSKDEEEAYSEAMAWAIILTLRQRGYEIVKDE